MQVYGQNGDKSKRRQVTTATEMAIVKTSTNPNYSYSSSDAYMYIIDRIGCIHIYGMQLKDQLTKVSLYVYTLDL